MDFVLTSTTKSLLPISNGIAMPCTGVVRLKFMLRVKSRIHDDSSGVNASNDLASFAVSEAPCAMV